MVDLAYVSSNHDHLAEGSATDFYLGEIIICVLQCLFPYHCCFACPVLWVKGTAASTTVRASKALHPMLTCLAALVDLVKDYGLSSSRRSAHSRTRTSTSTMSYIHHRSQRNAACDCTCLHLLQEVCTWMPGAQQDRLSRRAPQSTSHRACSASAQEH